MGPRSWQLLTKTPGKMGKIPLPKWQKIRITPQRGSPGQEQHPCRAQGLSLLHECPCLYVPVPDAAKASSLRALPPTLGFSKEDAEGISQSKRWLGIELSVVARKCCYPFPELGDDKHWGLPPFSCDPSRRGGWSQRGGEERSVIV